jgi:hypothetical protein
MPSAYLEGKSRRDTYIRQKAQLIARLKHAFACDLSTLSCNFLAQTMSASRPLLPPSPSLMNDALARPSPLLMLLQYSAEMYAQGFPHEGCFEMAIRVATYLVSTLKEMLHNTASTASHRSNDTALFVCLHKCAWVIYCLLERRNPTSSYGIITALLVDEVTQAFDAYNSYSGDTQLPPALELLKSEDYAFEDPLQTIYQSQDTQTPIENQPLLVVGLANPQEKLLPKKS